MTSGVPLADIHPAVEAGVNDADLDALVALYEPGAVMVLPDGSSVTGTDAIREQYAGILAMQGRMSVRTRFTVEAGDVALLSNRWTFTAGGEELSAVTAEIVHRQPDGGWLYVLDHPWAGSEADELAEIAKVLAG
jgi:uncharacterized protein (TIGR02246 family)